MVTLPNAGQIPRAAPGARLPALSAPKDTTGPAIETLGKAGTQVADDAIKAEKVVRSREDTLARIRIGNAFKENAVDLSRKFETERDPNDPHAPSAFGKQLQEAADAALKSYQGGDKGRAQLEVDLEQARFGQVRAVATKMNEQDALLIDNSADAAKREGAAEVEGSVTGIEAAFFKLDLQLDNLRDTLTEDQIDDHILDGRAKIVMSALQPHVDNGTLAGADVIEAAIGRRDVQAALGAEQLRKLRGNVITIRATAEKGRIAGEQKLAEKAAILGIDVSEFTPSQRVKIAGLDPDSGRQTLSEKIVELQSVMGPDFEITEAMITKLAGATVAEGSMFGRGMPGRALTIVTRDAVAYGLGALDPLEVRAFNASVITLQQKTTFLNPETGLVESRTPKIPPFVIDALTRQGRGDLISETNRVADPDAPPPRTAPVVANQRTIWQMATAATGIGPTLTVLAGRMPGLGAFVDEAEETQVRNQLRIMGRELVRVMQNNPRYVDAERQDIAEDIDLEGGFWDTVSAFRNRVIGIDDALAIRQLNAFNAARNTNLHADERKHARNVLAGLDAYRERLGAPQIVQTEAEADKLAPGTVFRSGWDTPPITREVPKAVSAP